MNDDEKSSHTRYINHIITLADKAKCLRTLHISSNEIYSNRVSRMRAGSMVTSFSFGIAMFVSYFAGIDFNADIVGGVFGIGIGSITRYIDKREKSYAIGTRREISSQLNKLISEMELFLMKMGGEADMFEERELVEFYENCVRTYESCTDTITIFPQKLIKQLIVEWDERKITYPDFITRDFDSFQAQYGLNGLHKDDDDNVEVAIDIFN